MSRKQKRVLFLSLLLLVGVLLVNNSFQKTMSNSVEKNNIPTHRIPLNDLKKAAQSKLKSKNKAKRAPASIKTITTNATGIIDPGNKISTDAKQQLSQQLGKSLGSLASWKLSHVQSTKQGHKVLVELKDLKTQDSASYHALVEPKTGRILTTWHRQIHR